jgi:UDP-N-acetylglucosamine transferase subunit ALG13
MLEVLAPLLRAGGELEQKQGIAIETLWQTGCTPTDGLDIDTTPYLAASELDIALQSADLVVSHAGVGSALSALRAGRMPVLVPRDPSAGEVVDNHQDAFARDLERRGLALRRTAAELSIEDLLHAASRTVLRTKGAHPLGLES